jgi:hypothetical protein
MLMAAVSQTSLPCLNMLKEQFGGYISTMNRISAPKPKHSMAYIWSVRNKTAMEFLAAIYPYTVVKKEQIEVALTYPMAEADGSVYRGQRSGISDELHNQRLAVGQKLRDIRASMRTLPPQGKEEVDA